MNEFLRPAWLNDKKKKALWRKHENPSDIFNKDVSRYKANIFLPIQIPQTSSFLNLVHTLFWFGEEGKEFSADWQASFLMYYFYF